MSIQLLRDNVYKKCKAKLIDYDKLEEANKTQIHNVIREGFALEFKKIIKSFVGQLVELKEEEKKEEFTLEFRKQFSGKFQKIFKHNINYSEEYKEECVINCEVKDFRTTRSFLFENNNDLDDKSLDFYSIFLGRLGWKNWMEEFSPADFIISSEHNNTDNSIVQRYEIKNLPKELNSIPVFDAENYVPRVGLLEKLSEHISTGSRKIILSGISGLGKTFIAKHFVYHYYDTFNHIAWLNCGSGILNALTQEKGVELLDNLGLIHEYQSFLQGEIKEEELLSLTLNRLKKAEGNNLLVLDNIDESIYDFEDAIELSKNWKIIGTSQQILNGFLHFPIPDFSENAIELFYKFYEIEKDDDNLVRVLSVIEYHTLAIELLAKTAQQRGLRIIELVNRFIENGVDVVEKAKIITGHSKERKLKIENIEEYIHIIFDTSSLDETECKILLNLALLQEEPIPILFFEEILLMGKPDKKSEDLLHHCISNLQNKGWLYKENTAIRLHNLTKEVIIKRLGSQIYLFKDTVAYLTHKVSYSEFDNYVERLPYLSFCENVIKNVGNVIYEIDILKNKISNLYFDLGLYHKSFEYFTFFQVEGHNEPMLYLQSLQEFGRRLYGLRKYDDAIHYYSKTLDYLNGKAGEKNIREIESEFLKFCETNILPENGENDSLVSFPLLVKFKITTYGHALNDLGLIFRIKGNTDDSLKICNMAVHHRQILIKGIEIYLNKNFEPSVFDENDLNEAQLNYAKALNGLALTFQSNKNYNEARKYFEMSLKIREELFNTEHPNLSPIYYNLSRLFLEMRDLENAKKYILLDIKACESLPPNHPEKIQAHNNFLEYHSLSYKHKNPVITRFISLMEQKIVQKIEIAFNKIGKRNIQEGKYYTDLLDYYYTIAKEYKLFEFSEKALGYFKKDLAIKQSVLEEGDIQLAGAHLNIADCLFKISQYDETVLYADKAKEIYRKHFQEDNPHIKYCNQIRNSALKYIYLSGNHDVLKQDIVRTLFPIIVLPNDLDISDETKLKSELVDLLVSENKNIDEQILKYLPKNDGQELMYEKLKEYYDTLTDIFSKYELWKKAIIFRLKKLYVQEKLIKNEEPLFIGLTNFSLSLFYYSDSQYELALHHNKIATKIYSYCVEEKDPRFDNNILKKWLQDSLSNQKTIEEELGKFRK
ncbi:MAG: tetratricopeptide repeat protein [Bergeyella sp.]